MLDGLSHLPANLRRLRAGLGVSQPQVQEGCGVAVRALANWERGRLGPRGPGLRDITKLARFYGVTIEWLLTDHSPVAAAAADEG